MEKMQLVVLAGGRASRLSPLSLSFPKGFLSIAQKPAIFNMLTPLTQQGKDDKGYYVDEIIFIVSPNNKDVIKSFVEKTYSNLKTHFIVQEDPEGPLQAFSLAEPYINNHTLLLLGDTLCETNLDYSYDWLGYQVINDNSHSRWCLIQTDVDNKVIDIIDKPDYTPKTNKVLIGLYNFVDHELLKECLKKEYPKIRGEYQLSSMIADYNTKRQMCGLIIQDWHDTGTLKDYNETARLMVSGREFNNFQLDNFNVLTKTSSYSKLKNEIYWLETIQNSDMSFLIPQYLGNKIEGDSVSYKIEYVGANALCEYFCYYDIPQCNWEYMFSRLVNIASVMWNKKQEIPKSEAIENAKYMYIDKTIERINQWDRKDILSQEFIYANGEKLLGFEVCMELLKEKFDKLIKSSPQYNSIIHGDLCFSNILYIPTATNYKFIDPRGQFGNKQSIYGDKRYDVAKLRHSYHGLYDYVNSRLFRVIEKSKTEFEYEFTTSKMINPDIFDNIIERDGFDINEIELIEAMLFISMIPLHSDCPDAQIMYYIIGLKCLNNQLRER